MSQLIVHWVQAYVCHGMWQADCSRPDCNNAEALKSGQGTFHCSNCRQIAPVEWPPDADKIWDVLGVRPVPQTRNWAPAGHRQAISCRVPDGQSVDDLLAENAMCLGGEC